MASTPESKAKKIIIEALKSTCHSIGAVLYFESHAGDGFSTPTLDITGAIKYPGCGLGVPFAVEVKRFDGKGKLTGRQEKTIRDMRHAGIAVFVVASQEELDTLTNWITFQCTSPPYTSGT